MGIEIKNLKVFITGGAGFIGSHLVDRLLFQNNFVTVYDNLSSGKEEFIRQHYANPNFRAVKSDLLDFNRLLENMRGNDIVFHLAANPDVKLGSIETRLDLEQNVIATYNVLESMRRNDIRRIVFTSSGTVYGNTPDIPVGEDYGPLFPISLYGTSKLACEGFISAFCHLFSFQSWMFRFGNIVGPRVTHGVIYDLINKLRKDPTVLEVLGDGNQTKPYVYVSDCIDGIFYSIQKASDQINLFNLAVPTVTNVKGIVKMILKKTGHEGTLVKYSGGSGGWPGDVPRIKLSIERIKRLGWEAKFTSDEAVSKTIDSLI
jgi:UDP-glucose 4-epimerase